MKLSPTKQNSKKLQGILWPPMARYGRAKKDICFSAIHQVTSCISGIRGTVRSPRFSIVAGSLEPTPQGWGEKLAPMARRFTISAGSDFVHRATGQLYAWRNT